MSTPRCRGQYTNASCQGTPYLPYHVVVPVVVSVVITDNNLHTASHTIMHSLIGKTATTLMIPP
jgi:hypothetical protein